MGLQREAARARSKGFRLYHALLLRLMLNMNLNRHLTHPPSNIRYSSAICSLCSYFSLLIQYSKQIFTSMIAIRLVKELAARNVPPLHPHSDLRRELPTSLSCSPRCAFPKEAAIRARLGGDTQPMCDACDPPRGLNLKVMSECSVVTKTHEPSTATFVARYM